MLTTTRQTPYLKVCLYVLLSSTGIRESKMCTNLMICAHRGHSLPSLWRTLTNDTLVGFLSKDMTYSCAIFPTLDADLQPQITVTQISKLLTKDTRSTPKSPQTPGVSTPSTAVDPEEVMKKADTDLYGVSDELYDAQIRKLSHIVQKADIRSGMKVSVYFLLLQRSQTA